MEIEMSSPALSVYYYSWLQYKNVRPDYLTNIWKVVNWKYAGGEYEKVLAWFDFVWMGSTSLLSFPLLDRSSFPKKVMTRV